MTALVIAIPCVTALLLALLVRNVVLRLAEIASRDREARARDELAGEIEKVRATVAEHRTRLERLQAAKALGRA